jgi:hypothetical protein
MMTETSRQLLESKTIKELESILRDLSKFSRVQGCLSINDVAHALFLMKIFVVYPRNYGSIKFDSEQT